ncbi:MAG: pyridoxal phosphate-dependent decarboxylase family protein [Terriglobales bacterium]
MFDFDSATRRRLGYKIIDRIDEYFASLPQRAVQLPAEERTFGPLHRPLPELGEDAEAVLDEITRELVGQGFHVPSANYFGLMNPTPAYMAVLAEALVAALNPQLATLARSQLASKIEVETVRWLGERVGWAPPFDGTFTSGGGEANFSALALALAWHFPAAIEQGVASIGAQPVLYASTEAHHTMDKSAGLLGIGRTAVRRVAVNRQLQLDLAALEAAIAADRRAGHRPFCVAATAGTTSSGAVDDVLALSGVCRRENLWLHLDGAYGAAAIFSDRHRHLVRGVELCDSVTIDPHKWLAMPFAAGAVLTSHPEALERAFSVVTPYMPRDPGAVLPDNSRISMQWSRRMNSLKLWLTLRVHGRLAYEEHMDRQLRLAQDFAQWVTDSEEFELTFGPVLPIVNFRVQPTTSGRALREEEIDARNRAVVEAVTRDGRRWISTTRVNGRSVIRMMVISYLTEERHLAELEESLAAAARAT